MPRFSAPHIHDTERPDSGLLPKDPATSQVPHPDVVDGGEGRATGGLGHDRVDELQVLHEGNDG